MNKVTKQTYEAFLLDLLEGNLSPAQIQELMDFFQTYPELKPQELQFPVLHLENDSKAKFHPRKALKKPYPELIQRFEHLCIAELEKELQHDEQQELHVMLQTYPGLEINRTTIAQTILTHEVVKADFSYLYKQTPACSSSELCIQALEGELSPNQFAQFIEMLSYDESLKKEWENIQITKLSANPIIYPHKYNLLKTEKSKVIPLWLRISSAAAALLLLSSLILRFVNTSDKPNQGIAFNEAKQTQLQNNIRPHKNIQSQGKTSSTLAFPENENAKAMETPIALPPEINTRTMAHVTSMPMRKAGIIPDSQLSTTYLSLFPAALESAPFVENMPPKEDNAGNNTIQQIFERTKDFIGRKNITGLNFNEMQQNGLAETTRKEVNRISNGNIQWINEEMADGRRNRGVQIGRFEYSRIISK
jgi:hypothetical protein